MNRVSQVSSTQIVNDSPNNYILQHFLGSFIMICAGFGQYTIKKLFQNVMPLRKTEFMDECSVGNISLFILGESLHGFYLHGQSPSGKADANLDELLNYLEEEGAGKVRNRGLIERDQENLQSFEIYISYKMRITYDGIYGLQNETMINSAQTRDRLSNQSRIINIIRHLPKTLKYDQIYKLKTYMNSELKEKIQKISSQPGTYVREKTYLQRFLNFPPLELIGDAAEDIVFFKDHNMSFDECLITGIEWDWFLWDIFMFQMWMLTINSLWISIFCTYVCDKIMFWSRTFFGEKNLAKKAFIDNKFFN